MCGHFQSPIQVRWRRSHPQSKLKVHNIVNRYPMRFREVKDGTPDATRGDVIDLDGRCFKIRSNPSPVTHRNPLSAGRHQQHVSGLDRPERRNKRALVDQGLAQPVSRIIGLVREDPCLGDRPIYTNAITVGVLPQSSAELTARPSCGSSDTPPSCQLQHGSSRCHAA